MNEELLAAVAKPEQIIPKYCNAMVFNKTEDDRIVMSFLFKSKSKEGSVQSVMIDTVFIDKAHAQQVIEKLGEIIKDIK